MSLPSIDFRSLTLDDVVEGLERNGYTGVRLDLEWTYENEALKYLGYNGHKHRWLMAYEDGDGNYAICWLLLTLDQNGLVFEYGDDIVNYNTEEAALSYLEQRCN
jgi:hypothetical protein